VNVTYFAKYSQLGPSTRYRLFQFLELFKETGIDVSVQVLFDDEYFALIRDGSSTIRLVKKIPYVAGRFMRRAVAGIRHNNSELNIIEHQLFPYVPFLMENYFLPEKFLVEFDDAIYLTHPNKLPPLFQQARGIIAGNETLADYARRYNNNVEVVPTVVNTALFQPKKKKLHSKLRIGWSGLEYNFRYLQILKPVLMKLMDQSPIEFVVLSGSPPVDLGFPFSFEKWDPAREVEQLNSFDIGVMPLAIDEWTKGKCGMKILQYMALEIASVATPVGVTEQIIQHGINGYHALTTSDWEARLVKLIEDPQLRQRLGEAARETVVDFYSVQVWFPKLLGIYRKYAHA
jgi:glycosyltransferase involved in cell wall biosynthesis